MELRDEHTAELKRIARILNEWATELPIRRVIVFGSRVRGDHRPDSDLDLAIDFASMPDHGDSLLERWAREEGEMWSGLQRALGIQPKRLEEDDVPIWKLLRAATARPVLEVDRVTFVLLPPALSPVRGKDSPVG